MASRQSTTSVSTNDAQLPALSALASQGALSRQPDNENFLLQDRFFFQMPRIPKFTYFVQSVSIPPYQYSSVEQPTRFVPIKRPGKNITFDELTVQFVLVEKMIIVIFQIIMEHSPLETHLLSVHF